MVGGQNSLSNNIASHQFIVILAVDLDRPLSASNKIVCLTPLFREKPKSKNGNESSKGSKTWTISEASEASGGHSADLSELLLLAS
jgi:hypothetical protein